MEIQVGKRYWKRRNGDVSGVIERNPIALNNWCYPYRDSITKIMYNKEGRVFADMLGAEGALATSDDDLMAEYHEGEGYPGLILSIGKNYLRKDGEVTAFLEPNPYYPGCFYDPKHEIPYTKDGKPNLGLGYEHLQLLRIYHADECPVLSPALQIQAGKKYTRADGAETGKIELKPALSESLMRYEPIFYDPDYGVYYSKTGEVRTDPEKYKYNLVREVDDQEEHLNLKVGKVYIRADGKQTDPLEDIRKLCISDFSLYDRKYGVYYKLDGSTTDPKARLVRQYLAPKTKSKLDFPEDRHTFAMQETVKVDYKEPLRFAMEPKEPAFYIGKRQDGHIQVEDEQGRVYTIKPDSCIVENVPEVKETGYHVTLSEGDNGELLILHSPLLHGHLVKEAIIKYSADKGWSIEEIKS